MIYFHIASDYHHLDSLFHAIAFAPSSALKVFIYFLCNWKSPLLDLSLNDFLTTLHISCYSLLSLTHTLESLFIPKSSITALSFIGSQQIVPGYGVMSIAKASLEATAQQMAAALVDLFYSYHMQGPKQVRVNILRALPLNTLAARGIPDFLVSEESRNDA